MRTRDDDGHANAAHKSSSQGRVHGFAQLGTVDLGQVSQGNAHNQGGFYPFPQGYDEGFEHDLSRFHDFENEFQFQLYRIVFPARDRQRAASRGPVTWITTQALKMNPRVLYEFSAFSALRSRLLSDAVGKFRQTTIRLSPGHTQWGASADTDPPRRRWARKSSF